MKLKALFGVIALTACATLPVTAMSAPTTPINFAKGSSCGSFDGNIVGRKFTLDLDANQNFTIDVDASKPVYPIVRDAKGRKLDNLNDFGFSYKTKTKGKNSVVFEVEDESYPFAELKFCAD